MAQSFQQQSLIRKLVYFGLILALFFATLVLRKQVVVAKAEELGLREKNQGEVELTGSALRLSLTGSRGLVVCVMWVMAQDMKMRHEWNELELVIRTLTKLQPHFITPWLFQTWDLAYNVSVEADRIRDEYFYISRGIDLLAEGQRQNQDSPDLRYHLGIYYQNKFGPSSDHNVTLRSLLQMSCIDPLERNPTRFRSNPSDRQEIDPRELADFCRKHPFLVRRLYASLGCKKPRDLIDFLEANQKIPTRFEEKPNVAGAGGTPLKPGHERFPILPDEMAKVPVDPLDELRTNESELGDDFDNFMAAKAWFSYAQDPLALPQPRITHQGAIVLFQQTPPRAQAYVGEWLEKEGWFDEELWPLSNWVPKETLFLGDPRRTWATDAWNDTYQMFYEHGRSHNLLERPATEESAMSPDDLRTYRGNRSMTNFDHWLIVSEVEKEQETVSARKCFFEAEQGRLRADPWSQVVKKYEDPAGFGPPSTWTKAKATGWTKIFFTNPRVRKDSRMQEDTYELQLKYLDAVQKARGSEAKRSRMLQAVGTGTAALPGLAPLWVPLVQLRLGELPPPSFPGPFDGVDANGEPWITAAAIFTVRSRRGEAVTPPSASSTPAKPPKSG